MIPDHIDDDFFFTVKFTSDGRAWLIDDFADHEQKQHTRWLGKQDALVFRARLAMMPQDDWYAYVVRIILYGPSEVTK